MLSTYGYVVHISLCSHVLLPLSKLVFAVSKVIFVYMLDLICSVSFCVVACSLHGEHVGGFF